MGLHAVRVSSGVLSYLDKSHVALWATARAPERLPVCDQVRQRQYRDTSTCLPTSRTMRSRSTLYMITRGPGLLCDRSVIALTPWCRHVAPPATRGRSRRHAGRPGRRAIPRAVGTVVSRPQHRSVVAAISQQRGAAPEFVEGPEHHRKLRRSSAGRDPRQGSRCSAHRCPCWHARPCC